MMSESPGLIEALEPVAKAFDSMDVRFYVGGSVASSYHGASRSTQDVDLVADLKRNNVDMLVDKLQKNITSAVPRSLMQSNALRASISFTSRLR